MDDADPELAGGSELLLDRFRGKNICLDFEGLLHSSVDTPLSEPLRVLRSLGYLRLTAMV